MLQRASPNGNQGLQADSLGIHMSLVNATTTPRLLRLLESGQLDVASLVTHRMS